MRKIHSLAKPLTGKALFAGHIGAIVFSLFILSCSSAASTTATALASPRALHPFAISSPDFHDGGPLSQKNEGNQGRCNGGNTPPQLTWSNVPAGTQSFALLLTDYDAPVAGGFHHWVVYNIPASAHELTTSQEYTQGKNGGGRLGYTGPCPPPTGEPHHYLFLLYALKVANIGGQGLQFADVTKAIQNQVVGATSIIGTFHLPQ